MNDVNKVLDVALAEVGYCEKSKKAYKNDATCLYDKTKGAGSDNYTKYGYEMHKIYPAVMDFPAAWCDCFVDWCFYSAYGVSNAKALLAGNFDDYTVASRQLYINKNAYHKTNPKVGDQIFFKNSTGKSVGHTGLVYKVDSKNVYTVEGNTSSKSGVVANGGCVALKQYSLSYSKIDGYGRPKYDASETEPVKEIVKPEPEKCTYVVTAKRGLNVRKSPSVSGKKITAMPCGTKFEVTAWKSGWGFISSMNGWCCLDYATKSK